MLRVRLVVAVSNAANRSGDATYARECTLPGVPRAGDTVVLGKWRPNVGVVEWHPDSDVLVVRLSPDHQTFKGADFGRACQKWESVGFKRE